MKNSILCLAVVLTCSIATAQLDVPNGDFEEWGMWNTWNYTPNEWITPNMQLLAPVEIDSNAYEGNFAMRVTPLLGFETAAAAAHTTFLINEIPEEFSFRVKTFIEEDATDSVRVAVRFLDSEDAQSTLYSVTWTATTSIDNWTLVSLPLDTDVVGATAIRVEVTCGYNGALGGGPWSTWISVDDMAVGATNGVSDYACLKPFALKLIGQQIETRGCGVSGQAMSLEMYDLSGKLLATKRGNSIDVGGFAEGLYLVRAYSNGIPVATEKFVLR